MSTLWKALIVVVSSFMVCVASAASAGEVSDTPHPENVSGRYWQRVFDSRHPEAPPQLVIGQTDHKLSPNPKMSRRPVVCVQAGDRLVLHQASGGASTLSLMARAIESGMCGAHIRVRIGVTGVVAEVTIVKQGIAILGKKGAKWR